MFIVYRLFGSKGQLLYVGMTNDLVKRFAKHKETHWIWDVESITAVAFPTRQQAHAVEVSAIRTESPRWNVMHTANPQQAISEFRSWERKRYTSAWPTHTKGEWNALARKLRLLARAPISFAEPIN